jgi:hypothetical protein
MVFTAYGSRACSIKTKKVVEENIINHRNAATGKGFEPF